MSTFKPPLSRMFVLALLLSAASCGPKAPGPFDAKIQEYAAMASLPEDVGQPYLAGKAVLINTGQSLSHHHETAFTKDDPISVQALAVSRAQEQILSQIRALNPGEVGAVVLLNWTKEVLRTNIAGIEFCRVLCDVTVVDHGKRRVVGKKQFAGSTPEGTHRWGSSPEKEIVEWINNLPRQGAAGTPST